MVPKRPQEDAAAGRLGGVTDGLPQERQAVDGVLGLQLPSKGMKTETGLAHGRAEPRSMTRAGGRGRSLEARGVRG